MENKKYVVDVCMDALSKPFLRGDYRELVELSLLYLNHGTQHFCGLMQPGALHKARWMAKILFSLKIVLLGPQLESLPKGTVLVSQTLKKITQFAQFVVFCYVPWWIKCAVASDAPLNDLQLFKSISSYKEIDKPLALAALKALGNHTWYLTEDLVSLSFFSDSVDNKVKENMVSRLLTFPVSSECVSRNGTDFGKPNLPRVSSDPIFLELSAFVGQDTWTFFNLLKLDTSFLSHPVTDWIGLDSYKEAKIIIDNLSVVNDAAERNVKLSSDFLSVAKKENIFQTTLQIVENNRNAVPKQRKRNKEGTNWFHSSPAL